MPMNLAGFRRFQPLLLAAYVRLKPFCLARLEQTCIALAAR